MLIFHDNMLEIVGLRLKHLTPKFFFCLSSGFTWKKIHPKGGIPTIFSHQHLQNREKTTVFCCCFNVLHPGSFPSVTFFFARSLDVLTSQFLRVMEEVPCRSGESWISGSRWFRRRNTEIEETDEKTSWVPRLSNWRGTGRIPTWATPWSNPFEIS